MLASGTVLLAGAATKVGLAICLAAVSVSWAFADGPQLLERLRVRRSEPFSDDDLFEDTLLFVTTPLFVIGLVITVAGFAVSLL